MIKAEPTKSHARLPKTKGVQKVEQGQLRKGDEPFLGEQTRLPGSREEMQWTDSSSLGVAA